MVISTQKISGTDKYLSVHHTQSKQVSEAKKSLSLEQQVAALKAKNAVLESVLLSIKDTASQHFDKKYDLVWFAKNRCRYPNHPKSKELDQSEAHREDINVLRGLNGDYHHGINCGEMATCRLFKEILDQATQHLEKDDQHILVNHKDIIQDHHEKVQEAKESFPNLSLEN
jgi:hypothetical protein